MKASVVAPLIVLCALFGALLPASVQGQGSLTPAGPPGPTMRTLTQIEPRVPIGALPFTITEPGAYYLTGNLTSAAGSDGIRIQASRVTLDLGGFALSGSGTSGKGIVTVGPVHSLTVRNGAVARWANGLDVSTGTSITLEALRVTENAADGVLAGSRSFLRHLTTANNGGSGIIAGEQSSLVECNASENRGSGVVVGAESSLARCAAFSNLSMGFDAGAGCLVESCAARRNGGIGLRVGADSQVLQSVVTGNGGHGVDAAGFARIAHIQASRNTGSGIRVDAGAHITDVAAGGNGAHGLVAGHDLNLTRSSFSENAQNGLLAGDDAQVTDCKAAGNAAGLAVGRGSLVRGCTAHRNRGDGVLAAAECVVIENHSHGNFNARDAAGIRITGGDGSVRRNHLTSNDRGLFIDGEGNVVLSNSAGNNSLNFLYVLPQISGPLVGNTNQVDFTNPWMNLDF